MVQQTVAHYGAKLENSTLSTTSPAGKRRRFCDSDDSDDDDTPPQKKAILIKMFGEKVVKASTKLEPPKNNEKKVKMEIDKYLDEPVLSLTANPLKWWRKNEHRYPVLSKVARKYLGIPASSVPCERLFSSAGRIISKQRALLKPDTAEMMIYLRANLK